MDHKINPVALALEAAMALFERTYFALEKISKGEIEDPKEFAKSILNELPRP